MHPSLQTAPTRSPAADNRSPPHGQRTRWSRVRWRTTTQCRAPGTVLSNRGRLAGWAGTRASSKRCRRRLHRRSSPGGAGSSRLPRSRRMAAEPEPERVGTGLCPGRCSGPRRPGSASCPGSPAAGSKCGRRARLGLALRSERSSSAGRGLTACKRPGRGPPTPGTIAAAQATAPRFQTHSRRPIYAPCRSVSRSAARPRPHRKGLLPLRPGVYSAPPQPSSRRPFRLAGPSTGQAGPRGRTAAGTSSPVTLVSTFVVLLALGLALRLIIAYVLLPGSGFKSDLGSFQYWANSIAAQGTVGYYSNGGFLDYPPVYPLLLDLLGHFVAVADGLLRGLPLIGSLVPAGDGVGETVKLIPIVSDALLAIVVRQMAQELGASKRRATIAAAVIVLTPVTWFNSAIWGQADAVGAVIMLLSLRELIKDRRESSAALAVLATLTKIQLGIVGFLVVFVIVRRSAVPRSGAADPMRILTSGAAGLVSAAVVCLPFTGFDFAGLGQRLGSAAGLLTVGAGLIAGLGVFVLAGRLMTEPEPEPEPEPEREGSEDAETGVRSSALSAGRMAVALVLGAVSAIVFAGMVFDSIASHIVNTFGEYPYLTLNAYNPWVLAATATGESMSRTLSWIHDAAWVDQGGSGPGYLIGFSTAGKTVALAAVALLAVGAIVAWNWAKAFRTEAVAEVVAEVEPGEPDAASAALASALDAAASSGSDSPAAAAPDSPGPRFRDAALAVWRSEFRAL